MYEDHRLINMVSRICLNPGPDWVALAQDTLSILMGLCCPVGGDVAH